MSRSKTAGKRPFPALPVLAGAAFLIGIAAWGITTRLAAQAELVKRVNEGLVPSVQVMHPLGGNPFDDVILPGSVKPWTEAPIYARTNGYVRNWNFDIGAKVKKGAVLADLDSPEIDAQLRQAQADLATAQANEALAQSTAARWQALLATDSVSRQENDEKQAEAKARHAALLSAQANLLRLQELEGFEHVAAPFEGVVTARNTDIGALINSGAASGSALFRLADVSRLRIYVQVSENFATSITPGIPVQVTIAAAGNRKVPGKVVHTANALDSASRSLMVEIQVDNPDQTILPGGLAEVSFHLPVASERPRLPVSTLIFRAAGLQIATVDKDLHAHLVSIKLGRDFGTSVEVVSGLSMNDLVMVGPPESLSDGDLVRIATAPDQKAGP